MSLVALRTWHAFEGKVGGVESCLNVIMSGGKCSCGGKVRGKSQTEQLKSHRGFMLVSNEFSEVIILSSDSMCCRRIEWISKA
jgi:hypothetical protein